MKTILIKILSFLFFVLVTNLAFSQEWNNIRQYQKEVGNDVLNEGSWLKKDRKKQTTIWKKANMYNLGLKNGDKKYKTISQIRDFYLWFDAERIKQGHEIKWIGVSAVAIGQLSNLDIGVVRVFIIRNKEVVKFANEGSKKVFSYAFPKLKQVYFSASLLKGNEAEEWDENYGIAEQCKILDALFNNLSDKAYIKLERMVKGKGIYTFGVPKRLKFEGILNSCKSRIDYGNNKILPYYLNKKR